MNPTQIEKLYSILKGYEQDVNDLANSIAFLGQDLGYVLKELRDHIESERGADFKEIEEQIDGVDCEIID